LVALNIKLSRIVEGLLEEGYGEGVEQTEEEEEETEVGEGREDL